MHENFRSLAPQFCPAKTYPTLTIETDEYYWTRRLTTKGLNPDGPELPADNSIPSGTILSSLYQQLSNKASPACSIPNRMDEEWCLYSAICPLTTKLEHSSGQS